MNESDARYALLVRAYETAPSRLEQSSWTDDDRKWATQAARQSEGEQAGEDDLIACRARIAAQRLCARDRNARRAISALVWRPWVAWALALAAFVAGIGTDAIASARHINILAPPLLGVIAWNLVVYVAIVWRAVTHFGGARVRRPAPLARVLTRLMAHVMYAIVPARRTALFAPPLTGFAHTWSVASAALSATRVARMLHMAAAALAAGALLGIYVRGFALEYRAGWESTFLDAASVHAILSVVLGPAASITGITVPGEAALAAIRFAVSPGENAAKWIHLYAMTTALFVLGPRALMALAQYFAERRLARDFPLPIADGYFQSIIRTHRGEAAKVLVVPYSYQPCAQAAAGLKSLMTRVFGTSTEVSIHPVVTFGDEETFDPALLAEPVALVVALFSLTATPERENHVVFIEALSVRIGVITPFAVLVDESTFMQRFAQSGKVGSDRRNERRAAWRHALAECDRKPVFVDLYRDDSPDVDLLLQAKNPQLQAC